MALKVKDFGTWKAPNDILVKDSGTWKSSRRVYIKDGGQWKEVYSNSKASCKEWLNSGSSVSGVYLIDPVGNNSYEVYCDMTTDGGGWTLILKYDKAQATDSLFGLAENAMRFDKNLGDLTSFNKTQNNMEAFTDVRPFISNGASEFMHTSLEYNDLNYSELFYSDIFRTVRTNPNLIWNSANDSTTMSGSTYNYINSNGITDKTRWYHSDKSIVSTDMANTNNVGVYADLDANLWSASMFSNYNREGNVYCSASQSLVGHASPFVNWGFHDTNGNQQSYGTSSGRQLKVGCYCNKPIAYSSANNGSCAPLHNLNLMWIR